MFKFKPFEEVLVRNGDSDRWHVDIFDYEFVDYHGGFYKCLSGTYPECIPFKGNEEYYLTTKKYEEPWIPERYEVVAVSNDKEHWYIKQFMYTSEVYKDNSYIVIDTDGSYRYMYCEPLSKHFKCS